MLSTCLRTEVYAVVDRFHDAVHEIQELLADRAGVPVGRARAARCASASTTTWPGPPLRGGLGPRVGRPGRVRGPGPGPPGLGAGPGRAGERAGAGRALPPRRAGRQAGALGDGASPGARPRSPTPRWSWPSGAARRPRRERAWSVVGAGEMGVGRGSAPWRRLPSRRGGRPRWWWPTAPPSGPSALGARRCPAGAAVRVGRPGRPARRAGRGRRAGHRGGGRSRIGIGAAELGPAGRAGRPAAARASTSGCPATSTRRRPAARGRPARHGRPRASSVARPWTERRGEAEPGRGDRGRRGRARYRAAARARGAAPVVAALRSRLEESGRAELERRRGQFAELSEEDWAQVDAVTRAVLAKLVHEPTVLLEGDRRHPPGRAAGGGPPPALRPLARGPPAPADRRRPACCAWPPGAHPWPGARPSTVAGGARGRPPRRSRWRVVVVRTDGRPAGRRSRSTGSAARACSSRRSSRRCSTGGPTSAVHSAKDLPSVTPAGPGAGRRARPGRPAGRAGRLGRWPTSPPGAVVATGSARRRAQLANLRPDLTFVELRGNMGTRLGRAGDGRGRRRGGGRGRPRAAGWADRIGRGAPDRRDAPPGRPGRAGPRVPRRRRRHAGPLLGRVDDPAAHRAVDRRAGLPGRRSAASCTLPVAALGRAGRRPAGCRLRRPWWPAATGGCWSGRRRRGRRPGRRSGAHAGAAGVRRRGRGRSRRRASDGPAGAEAAA